MKRVSKISCYTDYPFTELGDEPYKLAPIRRVRVLRYDGNKYATVTPDDGATVLYVKAGYLYSAPARCGTARVVNRRKLELMRPMTPSRS